MSIAIEQQIDRLRIRYFHAVQHCRQTKALKGTEAMLRNQGKIARYRKQLLAMEEKRDRATRAWPPFNPGQSPCSNSSSASPWAASSEA